MVCRRSCPAFALLLLLSNGCGRVGFERATRDAGSDGLDAGQAMQCADLIPTMTGNTTPSGMVTASGIYGADYEPWHAFDSTCDTATAGMWLSEVGVAPAWIAYEFTDGPKIVRRYAIRYTNGSLTSRAPRDWQFQGWNGATWITLDSQAGQTAWTSGERREFAIATPAAYTAFRLYVTEDNDTRTGMVIVVVSIGELFMLDT